MHENLFETSTIYNSIDIWEHETHARQDKKLMVSSKTLYLSSFS